MTRRDEIVRHAGELFRKKGYARTTVRDIGEKVGIQSGSLFRHFASKEEILLAVMVKSIDDIIAVIKSDLPKLEATSERLRALIRIELRAILNQLGEGFILSVTEWDYLSDDGKAAIAPHVERYNAVWVDILNEAQADGLIRIDNSVLRELLRGATRHVPAWFDQEGTISLDQLVDAIFEMATVR